jgi:hypothetical protein
MTTRREIRRHYEREVRKYASPFNHEVMIYCLCAWFVVIGLGAAVFLVAHVMAWFVSVAGQM